jgi:hypothetical protein
LSRQRAGQQSSAILFAEWVAIAMGVPSTACQNDLFSRK